MVDREEVIGGIRAALISTKGGVPENVLSRDYAELMGAPIPYRQLGFSNLTTFLKSIGSLKFMSGPRGEVLIDAIPDSKTGHISELVARARSSKRKGRSRASRGGYGGYTRSVQPRRPSLPNYQATRLVRAPAQARLKPSVAAPPVKVSPPSKYRNPPVIPQRVPLTELKMDMPQSPVQPTVSTWKEEPVIPQRIPLMELKIDKTFDGRSKEQAAPMKGSAQSRLQNLPPPSRPPQPAPLRPDVQKIHNSVRQAHETLNVPGSPCPVEKSWNAAEDNVKVSTDTSIEKQQEETECIDIQWLQSRTYPSYGTSKTPLLPLGPSCIMRSKAKDKDVGQELASVVKPKQQPRVVFQSFVQEVIGMCRDLKIKEPEFKVKVRRPTNEPPAYTAQISISELEVKLTSFPEERGTFQEATELVAKSALEELKKKKEMKNAALLLPPQSDSEIVKHLKEIIDKFPNGVFASYVVQQYSEHYNQHLPDNWSDLLDKCPDVCLERAAGSIILYPIKGVSASTPVVSPKPAHESLRTESLPVAGQKPSSTTEAAPKPVPSRLTPMSVGICSSQGGNNIPPKLTLPEDNTWEVYVTNAISPSEVWLRLIGESYDDPYLQVMNNMEMKLIDGGQMVLNPQIDGYYAVHLDNWLRVQLKEITPASDSPDGVESAEVFLIDVGEEDTVPLEQLCVLDAEFASVPAQAVKCRLAFTEMLTDSTDAMSYISEAIGVSFVAKVLHRPAGEAAASIILYDTRSGEAVDVNQEINKKAIQRLQPPKLTQRGFIPHEAHLTHVAEGGPLSLLIRSEDVEYLENILHELALQDLIGVHGVSAYPSPPADLTPSSSTMFLARSEEAPGKWRRAVFAKSTTNHRQVEVLFIDYGYVESVNISNLLVLEKVYPPLCKFPKQAIQVQLSSVPLAQVVRGVVSRLVELAPPHIPLMCKVIEVGSPGQLPSVELFKRIPPDNIIASINTNLVFNLEKYMNNVDNTAVNGLKFGVEVKSRDKGALRLRNRRQAELRSEFSINDEQRSPKTFQSLEVPEIPEVGLDYFDVVVTMASNPSNFFVQPLKDQDARVAVQDEMQELYKKQSKIMPIPDLSDLQVGVLFAAYHTGDDMWYRVSINNHLGGNRVSVHYFDYGDISVVSVDQLRFLDPRFQKLPYQAIKAKLSGVKPVDCDWTPEDCIRFQDLVVNKSLVSQIMEKGPDLLPSPQDTIIGLKLIDTHDPDKDVYIDQLLIEEGRAVGA